MKLGELVQYIGRCGDDGMKLPLIVIDQVLRHLKRAQRMEKTLTNITTENLNGFDAAQKLASAVYVAQQALEEKP